MKLHRFYIDHPLDKCEDITLSDREVLSQWKNVLRFRVGRQIVLFNGDGKEFHGVIELLSKDKGTVSCVDIKENFERPKLEVTLYVSVIKKDKFEWVMQKCTEIGVSHFVPVISERTEKMNINMERAEKIVKEAAEQSGRVTLPTVSQPVPLKDAFDQCETDCYALEEEGSPFGDLKVKAGEKISIFIGPEGGWDDVEKEMFEDKKISLGYPTLRAETASVAMSTLLLLS